MLFYNNSIECFRWQRFLILIFILFFFLGLIVQGEANAMSDIPFSPNWSKNEKWAWTMITNGNMADFNKKLGYKFDTNKINITTDEISNRLLSSSFLRTILVSKEWNKYIGKGGVQIVGAYFEDTLNLFQDRIFNELHLDGCLINSGFIFVDGKCPLNISLSGSTIRKELNFQGANINGGLYLSGKIDKIRLTYTTVSRELSIKNCLVKNGVNADHLKVGGNLFMYQSKFVEEFILSGANIESNIDITNCYFNKTLQLDSTQVAGNINLKKSQLNNLEAKRLTVDGQVNFDGIKVKGDTILDFSNIESTLFLGSRNKNPNTVTIESLSEYHNLSISGVKIGNDLSLRLAKVFGNTDINSSIIGGKCILGPSGYFGQFNLTFSSVKSVLDFQGAQFKRINLTGTSTFYVIDSDDTTWPDKINLFGFTYKYFGTALPGNDVTNDFTVVAKDSKWFTEWLNRLVVYSPQPYEEAVKVLKAMGDKEASNDILYDKENHELELSTGFRKLWLYTLKYSIGYGIGMKYFYCLWVVIPLVIVGVLVCRTSPEWSNHNVAWWIAYSVEQLLPIFNLGKSVVNIKFGLVQELYFILHNIFGFTLASFIVAGLAGITK